MFEVGKYIRFAFLDKIKFSVPSPALRGLYCTPTSKTQSFYQSEWTSVVVSFTGTPYCRLIMWASWVLFTSQYAQTRLVLMQMSASESPTLNFNIFVTLLNVLWCSDMAYVRSSSALAALTQNDLFNGFLLSDNGEFTDVDQWWTWRDDVFHSLHCSHCQRLLLVSNSQSLAMPLAHEFQWYLIEWIIIITSNCSR